MPGAEAARPFKTTEGERKVAKRQTKQDSDVRKYIVDGTTINYDGVLYEDGEEIELPFIIAAGLHVRPVAAEVEASEEAES